MTMTVTNAPRKDRDPGPSRRRSIQLLMLSMSALIDCILRFKGFIDRMLHL